MSSFKIDNTSTSVIDCGNGVVLQPGASRTVSQKTLKMAQLEQRGLALITEVATIDGDDPLEADYESNVQQPVPAAALTLADVKKKALYFRDFREGGGLDEFVCGNPVPMTATIVPGRGLALRDPNRAPGDVLYLYLNNVTNMRKATIIAVHRIDHVDLSWVTSTSTSVNPNWVQLSLRNDYFDKVRYDAYGGLYTYSLKGLAWSNPGFKPISSIYTTSYDSGVTAEEGRTDNVSFIGLYTQRGNGAFSTHPKNVSFLCLRHIDDNGVYSVRHDYDAGFASHRYNGAEPGTEVLPGNLALTFVGFHGTYNSPFASIAIETSPDPAGYFEGLAVFEETLTNEEILLIKNHFVV